MYRRVVPHSQCSRRPVRQTAIYAVSVALQTVTSQTIKKQAVPRGEQQLKTMPSVIAVSGGSQLLSSMQQQLPYKGASGSNCMLGAKAASATCSPVLQAKALQQLAQQRLWQKPKRSNSTKQHLAFRPGGAGKAPSEDCGWLHH